MSIEPWRATMSDAIKSGNEVPGPRKGNAGVLTTHTTPQHNTQTHKRAHAHTRTRRMCAQGPPGRAACSESDCRDDATLREERRCVFGERKPRSWRSHRPRPRSSRGCLGRSRSAHPPPRRFRPATGAQRGRAGGGQHATKGLTRSLLSHTHTPIPLQLGCDNYPGTSRAGGGQTRPEGAALGGGRSF